jgi:chaperonin GroEL (HSP60 family)
MSFSSMSLRLQMCGQDHWVFVVKAKEKGGVQDARVVLTQRAVQYVRPALNVAQQIQYVRPALNVAQQIHNALIQSVQSRLGLT